MTRLAFSLLAIACCYIALVAGQSDDATPRHVYPAACCRYILSSNTLEPLPLPRRTEALDATAVTTYASGSTLVSRNGAEAAHCVGDTLSVWSLDGRNFTRRVSTDAATGTQVEEHGPVALRNGNQVVVQPMDSATLSELDGKLVRLDLECSIEGTSQDVPPRGTDCAFIWLGDQVDTRALTLPPCLSTGPVEDDAAATPPQPAETIDTTSPPPSGEGAVLQPVNAATAHSEVTTFGVVLGVLVVIMFMQIVLLFDAVEHRVISA